MKNLILFLCLIFVGCAAPAPQNPQPQPQPQVYIPPPTPSATFMEGYWDGYYGNWLGPLKWASSEEYRHGWSLGSQDRKNGVQRYPKELH